MAGWVDNLCLDLNEYNSNSDSASMNNGNNSRIQNPELDLNDSNNWIDETAMNINQLTGQHENDARNNLAHEVQLEEANRFFDGLHYGYERQDSLVPENNDKLSPNLLDETFQDLSEDNSDSDNLEEMEEEEDNDSSFYEQNADRAPVEDHYDILFHSNDWDTTSYDES